MVGNVAWATDYSYTFSSQQYTADGAKTLNGVSWTMAGTGGAYFGYDGTKGQQFGSGNKPYSALSLSTSGISCCQHVWRKQHCRYSCRIGRLN